MILTIGPTDARNGATKNATSAAVASLVVKAGAGRLFKICGTNGNAAVRYIQLHDATALPANTAVPVFSIQVPIGLSFNIDWPVFGRQFYTGIVIASSSTLATLTIGAADMAVDAQFT